MDIIRDRATRSYSTRQFLDFEKDIQPDYEKLQELAEKGGTESAIKKIEEEILKKRKHIHKHLSAWQKVQLSRHPNRPYTQKYIDLIFDDFYELRGDRFFGDDKALVGGFASLEGKSVMVVGHQKGYTTKQRQYHNFGMAHPEGYRKAFRLFELAEKFGKPVICFIDTPGAFPGIDAENRGQGEAIAKNIIKMMGLNVPIICIVIGEGASGGALGLGVGDATYMMENTWFSVISPESCSSILWKSWDHKEQAAEQLRLTAQDMYAMKLIDDIIKEPVGGAHWDYRQAAQNVKRTILLTLSKLEQIPIKNLTQKRIDHYLSIGIYKEEK